MVYKKVTLLPKFKLQKKLKSKGFDTDTIHELTGLSIEEISNL